GPPTKIGHVELRPAFTPDAHPVVAQGLVQRRVLRLRPSPSIAWQPTVGYGASRERRHGSRRNTVYRILRVLRRKGIRRRDEALTNPYRLVRPNGDLDEDAAVAKDARQWTV